MDSVPFSLISGLQPCALVRLLYGPSEEPKAGLRVVAAELISKGPNICIYHGEQITKNQMLQRRETIETQVIQPQIPCQLSKLTTQLPLDVDTTIQVIQPQQIQDLQVSG
ncbi:hypothetical protein RCL1_002906 [Eukaryota sp. TZLM3-RCL]